MLRLLASHLAARFVLVDDSRLRVAPPTISPIAPHPTSASDKMARFSTGLLVVALMACVSASRAVYVNGER